MNAAGSAPDGGTGGDGAPEAAGGGAAAGPAAERPTGGLEDALGGMGRMLGMRVEEAGPRRVRLRLTLDERHLQVHGIVHGGVHCALAEQAASIGATLSAREHDAASAVVGLENHTTFLRAARPGTDLVAEAVPRHAGRRVQSWSAVVSDADGRELAISTVRLLVVRPGTV